MTISIGTIINSYMTISIGIIININDVGVKTINNFAPISIAP